MTVSTILSSMFALTLAFIVGFATKRGSVCAVAATQQWVVFNRPARFKAFLVAAGLAGMLLIPLRWLFPEMFILAVSYDASWQCVVAGAVFGLSARLNGACAFGTLAHLTGGNLPYVMSVVGMIAGAIIGSAMFITGGAPEPSPVDRMNATGIALLALCILLAAPGFRRRHLKNLVDAIWCRKAPLRPLTAMIIIGVCSALLYGTAGDWTYLGVLKKQALAGVRSSNQELTAVLGAMALVSGGIWAALQSGRFKIQFGSVRVAAQCLIGGMGMGAAAAVIPGGNGALLVYGLPSASHNAITAYALMTIILIASFIPNAMRRRSHRL